MLRVQGLKRIDETSLFRAVDHLRAIAQQAASARKAARRQQARTQLALGSQRERSKNEQAPSFTVFEAEEKSKAKPFLDTETW